MLISLQLDSDCPGNDIAHVVRSSKTAPPFSFSSEENVEIHEPHHTGVSSLPGRIQ